MAYWANGRESVLLTDNQMLSGNDKGIVEGLAVALSRANLCLRKVITSDEGT